MVNSVILQFLNDLSVNNNREWFHANKDYYQKAKLAFDELALRLIAMINEVDPSVGLIELKDCTYRIYRDTRFSTDKTPYKTHMGAYIVRGGKKSPFAGYYFHFEPGKCFAWGGSHIPEPRVLNALREEIYHKTDQFKAIVHHPDFVDAFGCIEGEKLKTAPKGFDKQFADMDLLRYKSYGAMHTYSDQEVLAPDYEQQLKELLPKMVPLVAFLNNVVEDLV